MRQAHEVDQLSKEVFACCRCGKECSAREGCWPETAVLADGTTEDLSVTDWSTDWLLSITSIAPPFVCYQCLEKHDAKDPEETKTP